MMSNIIPTPAQFAEEMLKIYPPSQIYDEECAHGAADELLCDLLNRLGYGLGVAIYNMGNKWYA